MIVHTICDIELLPITPITVFPTIVIEQLTTENYIGFQVDNLNDIDYDNQYYLYILSNDYINDNDWVLHKGEILKVLKTGILYNGDFTIMISETLYLNPNACKKIIATNNSYLIKEGVASIANDFILKYISDPIKEVSVKFEEFLTDGWIPTYNNPDNHNFDEPAEIDYRPMISSDGSIILNY